jgi:shikimate kinase / 3-dehydroquinate synthase
VLPERIFLIGLSGSGKSTVGERVASALGWGFIDVDRQLESRVGRPIPEIFVEDGEEVFRELESAELESCLSRQRVVVATGGGAITTPRGRHVIEDGFSVWLSVSPSCAAARLAANPATEERPLLNGDLQDRLATLLKERIAWYQLADAAVDVDEMTAEQVADEVVTLWGEHRSAPAHGQADGHGLYQPSGNIAAVVHTPSASYPIVVANGAVNDLGAVCRDEGLKGRAFVLADSHVLPHCGDAVRASLDAAGYPVEVMALSGGEAEKNLATVSSIYDWLIEQRAERGDFAVCLGGGVVTDMGGFAAATYLRGIAFVHVPTTLLGMVDAAIGGKTGVDHPKGKNLIGAFAQPRAVLIDPELLATLPRRELRAGWAEVLKHGLILDRTLFDELAAVADDPRAMVDPRLIGWSAAIKAAIVSEDEQESDRRMLLNYGHTLGHAIEAVTGYSGYLHGEAVAVGMRAAGLMAVELGMLSPAEFDLQQGVLRRCGLPESAPEVPIDAVLDATLRDKKVSGGRVRWVLLEGIGSATVTSEVPPEIVRRAVETVLA